MCLYVLQNLFRHWYGLPHPYVRSYVRLYVLHNSHVRLYVLPNCIGACICTCTLPFFLLGINPYYQGERVGFNPKRLWIAAGNRSHQRQAKLLGDWIVMAKKPKARSQPTLRYPSQGGCPRYRINWDMMIEGKLVWYGRGFAVAVTLLPPVFEELF